MRYDIVTLFPEVVEKYAAESILGRAQSAGAITVAAHNPRDFTIDKHKTVDDTPYGGGAGMVLKVEPMHKCIENVRETSGVERAKSRTIVLSAKGKRFTQRDAERLAEYDQLILVCGRYEGIDERIAEHVADEELSIGDFVLTGGELGALVITDAVARLVPEVLGNAESAVTESHSTDGYTEHPQYTKPAEYNGWTVPEVLMNGDHGKIAQWRAEHSGGTASDEVGDNAK